MLMHLWNPFAILPLTDSAKQKAVAQTKILPFITVTFTEHA